jgi:glucokinase
VMRVVADVGGTNSRLALSQSGAVIVETIRSYANDDWDNFAAVLTDFLSVVGAKPSEMVVAVAGPVNSGVAKLTNRNWTFYADTLADEFGLSCVSLLNDLTALGYAAPTLNAEQLAHLNGDTAALAGNYQALVVGIGTGFNVAPVVMTHIGIHCPKAEVGHISLPTSVQASLLAYDVPANPFTTVEDLFSGRGFEAYCRLATGDYTLQGRGAISSYGSHGAEAITKAINQYAEALGWLLRDLALSFMCQSGIFLAGSVTRSVMNCAEFHCLSIFNKPCRIRKNTVQPISIINDDFAALFGCATLDTAQS